MNQSCVLQAADSVTSDKQNDKKPLAQPTAEWGGMNSHLEWILNRRTWRKYNIGSE